MLHNVPVARILGYCFLAALVLLGIVVYQGYRTAADPEVSGVHIRFALFAIVVVLFTQTMALFYFVGTGSRIRKVVHDYRLDPGFIARSVQFKRRLSPWLTFTPLVTMAAFILGGGAHVRMLPGWVHGSLALAAAAMNLYTAWIALRCIGENVLLIDEIDAALPEGTGE